jgi:hypothetical protein
MGYETNRANGPPATRPSGVAACQGPRVTKT